MMRAANFLPWVAALSFGAFVAVLPTLPFGARFTLVFPIALGVCSMLGIPIALRWRANAGWLLMPVGIVVGLGIVIALISAITSLRNMGGEAANWVLAFTVSSTLVFLPIALVIAMVILVVAAIPAVMVLFLSGEVAALRRRVSIYDLPYPRLRASLLVLLAIAPPLAAYRSQYASGTHRPYTAAFGDDCRYDNNEYRFPTKWPVFIDADEPDWPQLKQVVERFAAAHAMRMVPGDPKSFARGDPMEYGVCMPGRFVFSFTKAVDVPGARFAPTGDRYVSLTPYVAKDASWEDSLEELAAAIRSRWPGMKLESFTDLRSAPSWPKVDTCRTKVAKMEYKSCLGALSDVRKETLYVHGKTKDWPRLQSLMAGFAASHGMTFKTNSNNNILPWNDLCAVDKVQIKSTTADARDVPVTRGEYFSFSVQITAYMPAADPDAVATVEQLVAALDAEWPGVKRSRPEPDFCRALKAQK